MSTATVITQQQAEMMVKRLEGLGTRLEFDNSPDWFVVAKAAAMLEALRLGLATISQTPAIWIGIDGAAPGTDQTVHFTRSDNHAH